MRNGSQVPLFDRLIAAGSYLTLGTVGMVWFLINFIVVKKPMSRFLTYNIFQSFILSILFAIISLAYSVFIGILTSLPFVGKLFYDMHIFLLQTPIYNTMNFINFIIFIFISYLAIFALFAQLPFIPFVSDLVKKINF